MNTMNRVHNIKNPYQGSRIKTLCICSAGLLRSPTLAYVLSYEPYDRNTRAVGYNKEYALISLEPIYLAWADEIVCVDTASWDAAVEMLADSNVETRKVKMYNLEIPDDYSAFSFELIEKINESLERIGYK